MQNFLVAIFAAFLPASVFLAQVAVPAGTAGPTDDWKAIGVIVTVVLAAITIVGSLLKVAFSIGTMTGTLKGELETVRKELAADRAATQKATADLYSAVHALKDEVSALKLWRAHLEGEAEATRSGSSTRAA